MAKDVIKKLARRIVEDPTRATFADASKLARAVLMLCGERP